MNLPETGLASLASKPPAFCEPLHIVFAPNAGAPLSLIECFTDAMGWAKTRWHGFGGRTVSNRVYAFGAAGGRLAGSVQEVSRRAR